MDEDDPQTSVEWLRTLNLPGNVEVVLAEEMAQADALRAENKALRAKNARLRARVRQVAHNMKGDYSPAWEWVEDVEAALDVE